MSVTPYGNMKTADLSAVVCAQLQQRLQAAQDVYTVRTRAHDLARAAAKAINILESDDDSSRRAIARQLRKMLVAAVHADDWTDGSDPALPVPDGSNVVAPSGAYFGGQIDIPGHGGPCPGAQRMARLELIFMECIDELKSAGFSISDNPIDQFLEHDVDSSDGATAGNMHILKSLGWAFWLSVLAWMITIGGLIFVIHRLTQAYVLDRTHPATTMTLRKAEALQIPVITICFGQANSPIFSKGGPKMPGNIYGLPLMTVTAVEVLPNSSSFSPRAFPDSVDMFREILHENNASSPGSSSSGATCAGVNTKMNPGKLVNGTRFALSEGLFDGPCTPCLQFGQASPVYLTEATAFRLRVATNRLYDYCLNNNVDIHDDRLLATFQKMVAERVDILRNRGLLLDPKGETNLTRVKPGDPEASLLFDFGRTSVKTSQATLSIDAETDFLCNIMFMSDVWYPASVDKVDISYIWNSSIGYWVRLPNTRGPYWDVTARASTDASCPKTSDGDELSATCVDQGLSSIATSRLLVYGAANQSVADSATMSTQVQFRYPVDASVTRARFKFRRKISQAGDEIIHAPVILLSREELKDSAKDLYRYVSLEFSFDGLVSEEWGIGISYSSWEYAIDLTMAISLFTGVSLFTVLMGLSFACLYFRAGKSS